MDLHAFVKDFGFPVALCIVLLYAIRHMAATLVKAYTDRISALEALSAQIEDRLEHVLGLRAPVRLVEPHTIQRSEGKAKRVIDKRVQA